MSKRNSIFNKEALEKTPTSINSPTRINSRKNAELICSSPISVKSKIKFNLK